MLLQGMLSISGVSCQRLAQLRRLRSNSCLLIGVPFVKADATKFSETGYVGGDVDDLVRDLVRKAGGNVKQAEHGIIYLDEVDKLATRGEGGGREDVGGHGRLLEVLS